MRWVERSMRRELERGSAGVAGAGSVGRRESGEEGGLADGIGR